MAYRLGDYIQSGYIDNSIPERVTGKLFFGEFMVSLDLVGKVAEDLVGCVLKFKNPYAKPLEEGVLEFFASEQIGKTGNITASHKCKIPSCFPKEPELGAPQETSWANILYIEWFSESNGRCLIEGVKYEWEIDLTEGAVVNDEEQLETKQAEKACDPNDEFAWETLLKQCDARVEDFMKEMDHIPIPEGKLEEILPDVAKSDEPESEEVAEWMPEPPSMTEEEWHIMDAEIWANMQFHLDEDLQIIVDGMRLVMERIENDIVMRMPEGEHYEQIIILYVKVRFTIDSMYDGFFEESLIIAKLKREIDRINTILAPLQETSSEKILIERLMNLRSQLLEFNKRLS